MSSNWEKVNEQLKWIREEKTGQSSSENGIDSTDAQASGMDYDINDSDSDYLKS